MPSIARASAAALLLLFVGCGSSPEQEAAPPNHALRQAAQGGAARVAPVLYDPDGMLLPSTTRIAGLTLPRGLKHVQTTGGESVFRTEVPIARVIAYFGPRLFTARVDRVGAGAMYRHARPTEARAAAIYLDVSILPASDGSTRVHVYELPPPISRTGDVEPSFSRLD